MNTEDTPIFKSENEEIKYWKDLATQYMEECDRGKKELDEYISESRQLEREYEATIDQCEKRNKELSLGNNRLQSEIESLRTKLEQGNCDNVALQGELTKIKVEQRQMSTYIRDLEQKNDDLERARRIIEESIAAIETDFQLAIERTAILESEVDEKENLQEKLQRLADESRDLKQELLVKERERCPDNERLLNGYKVAQQIVDSNKLKENETQTTPLKSEFQTSISPSARVMAVNLVSDIIRRVGGLERRLEKCRYDCRDVSKNEICRNNSAKNSPTQNVNGFKQ